MPADIILRFVPGYGWLPIGVRGNVATYSSSGKYSEVYRGEFRQTAHEALAHALQSFNPEEAHG